MHYVHYALNPEGILEFMQHKFGISYERAEEEYLRCRYEDEETDFLDRIVELDREEKRKVKAQELAEKRKRLEIELNNFVLPDLTSSDSEEEEKDATSDGEIEGKMNVEKELGKKRRASTQSKAAEVSKKSSKKTCKRGTKSSETKKNRSFID